MLTRVYFFQLIVMFLVAMIQFAGMFTTGPLNWIAWVGTAIWAVGMFFETVGDAQLAAFKADPANKGRIMDCCVWSWTRHPNYFGDTALCWGPFLVAASSWPGILTIASPLLMTWALAFRTGKPLTERRMVIVGSTTHGNVFGTAAPELPVWTMDSGLRDLTELAAVGAAVACAEGWRGPTTSPRSPHRPGQCLGLARRAGARVHPAAHGHGRDLGGYDPPR